MMQPPAQRTPHMPWPTYPMVLKTTSSHEEGADRFWGINTEEFLGDEDGNLRAIKVTDVTWELDVMNRPVKFNKVEGSEREIPCQRIFLAMGFLHPQFEGMLENIGIKLDARKNVQASEARLPY